jgi:hypothetical protein
MQPFLCESFGLSIGIQLMPVILRLHIDGIMQLND